MNKNREAIKELGQSLGVIAGHFLDSFLLMIAWNAIAAVTALPTFNYWSCFAILWTVRIVCGYIKRIIHGERVGK